MSVPAISQVHPLYEYDHSHRLLSQNLDHLSARPIPNVSLYEVISINAPLSLTLLALLYLLLDIDLSLAASFL